MDIDDSPNEDDVQMMDTPQLNEMEDAPPSNEMEDKDLLAEIETPELPHLLEALNDVTSQRLDDAAKLPRLEDPEEWRDRIRAQSNGHDYRLEAPTTADAALAFVALLTEMTRGCIMPCDYKPDLPSKCKIEDRCALLSPISPFFM